jgi:hypothetical protein
MMRRLSLGNSKKTTGQRRSGAAATSASGARILLNNKYLKGSVAGRSERKSLSVIATLVFDSLQTPSPAGVRGAAMGTRHLLYEATGVSIALNLDSLSATGDVLLTGQVLCPGEETSGICEVPVHLLHGRKSIAQTQTNKFGEFHLKGEAGKGMQLSVGVTEQKDIFILLDDSIWKKRFPRQD